MIPSDALWLAMQDDVKLTVWRYCRRRMDHQEAMSAAGEVFLVACRTHNPARMPFREWFLLRLGNRLRSMRRRLAIRHRLLPRAPFTEPLQPIRPFRLDDFMSRLHGDERQLVEEVIGYDQSLILPPINKPGAWPVKAIMVSVRHALRRKGWNDDRINRAIRWVKEVWGESA